MGKVWGIVYRTFATHITKKAGYNKQTAKTRLSDKSPEKKVN
jgi:hypothetical protein